MSTADRLPRRLPIGTRYVVEGIPGEDGELTIVSRQVLLPDGTVVRLPVTANGLKGARAGQRYRATADRKPARKRKPVNA